MKNVFLIMFAALTLTACGNRNNNKTATAETSVETLVQNADPSTVYVYYFHGKQRCMTCNTVEKVAKEVISEMYGENSNVKFQALSTNDKANEQLVEKYEITWNGLIVTKGNDNINITQQAFANAVNNPQALKDLIKSEVDKRIQ